MINLAAPVVSILLTGSALLLSVPVVVLVAQTCGYLWARRRNNECSAPIFANRPRIAVLMPAHDEADVIGRAIAASLPQLAPGDRLLVVADNCTDKTALRAQEAGAEVTERIDRSRRGKGFALDWGVRQLARDPPEVVIVIDADCIAEPGSLEGLARASIQSNRPVQATYRMNLQSAPSLRLRVAAFAWYFKNEVRALGATALGLPCQLMGTGMAFPWPLFRDASLASGSIVEDAQLGVDLAIAGAQPQFLPSTTVTSWFPASDSGARSQRTRWEHGHLAMITTAVPRLLREAYRQRRPVLAAMAFDFCVPPLALLVVLLLLHCAASVGGWLLVGTRIGLEISSVLLAMFSCCVAIAWLTGGRRVLGALQLLALPFYVLSKVPIYLRWALGRRQTEWVRTDRDNGGS